LKGDEKETWTKQELENKTNEENNQGTFQTRGAMTNEDTPKEIVVSFHRKQVERGKRFGETDPQGEPPVGPNQDLHVPWPLTKAPIIKGERAKKRRYPGNDRQRKSKEQKLIQRRQSVKELGRRRLKQGTSDEESSIQSAPVVLYRKSIYCSAATRDINKKRFAEDIWPPNSKKLAEAIKRALEWTPEPRTKPAFSFEMTDEAAEKNFELLKEHDFDLNKLLLRDPRSPLRPGSEFKPIQVLEPLFKGHPFWPCVNRSLLVGAKMPLEKLAEKSRVELLEKALEYGNHKSATSNAGVLVKMLKKEVWHLPLPIHRLREIPKLVVGPISLVLQSTIDEEGKVVPKYRFAHDQSFRFGLDEIKSVNDRTIESKKSKCVYGFAIRRFIHTIVVTRRRHPGVSILMSKLDFKSAYRRLHFHAETAIQSVVTTQGLEEDPIALASLRATFGGASCPNLFTEISESVADLANAIVRCDEWDSNKTSSAHDNLIGKPILRSRIAKFEEARESLRDFGADNFGTTDVFIDDLITAFPAISEKHVQRGSRAPLLALEIVGRPMAQREPLPRDPLLAIDKAIAEGTPSEVQTILGWQIDTRKLLIKLPDEKFGTWKSDTIHAWERGKAGQKINYAEIQTLIGRLQHTASILQTGRHFLNRLRKAEEHARRPQSRRAIRLTASACKDLKLWVTFLEKANRGIDLNLLVDRKPDRMIRTDACEHGLGGYSLTTGRAWRWEIPKELRNSKSINFLEFLACIAGILISIMEDKPLPGDCYLSLGDNTASLGWLNKSNFDESEGKEQAAHSGLARYFAMAMAEASLCQGSQWFAGKENTVADLLSRDHVKSDSYLTRYIPLLYKNQVSPEFKVSPLPEEITSLLTYWVRHKQDTTELPPELTRAPTLTSETAFPHFAMEFCNFSINSS
jgi:hypothetical protein